MASWSNLVAMKINVFGRIVEVARDNGEWVLYTLGEGKKRRENDIVIPADLNEKDVVTFIADIFHEFATPGNSEVKVLK